MRQRLLDPALVQAPGRQIERKLKEIIQSIRLTEAFPGTAGKQEIITAYLNQNYYGNNSYGVQAAAQGYFGVTDLNQLTLAQAAIIAAIPQSPVAYDLVRNAVQDDQGRLVVPADSAVVQRRNFILELLRTDPTRRVLTGTRFSDQDFVNAENEPVVITTRGAAGMGRAALRLVRPG